MQKRAVILHMRLLIGRIGIAEEYGGFLRAGGIVFKGGDTAEFAAVIRQQNQEKLAKGIQSLLAFSYHIPPSQT